MIWVALVRCSEADGRDKPPREGDLYEAMREMADQTMGKPIHAPKDRAAAPAAPKIELLGFPGCPNTPAMREHLKAALASIGKGWAFADIDQERLPEGDLRRGYPTPTVLVNGRDLYGACPSPPRPGGDAACTPAACPARRTTPKK